MSISILECSWKVERIDTLIGIQIDVEVGSSDGIDECFVLIFRIEDDDVRPEHESTENLELDGKRLSSS